MSRGLDVACKRWCESFFTLQTLPGWISVFFLVPWPQVTLGVFDLKPGLLFDWWSQCVFTQKRQKGSLSKMRWGAHKCIKYNCTLILALSLHFIYLSNIFISLCVRDNAIPIKSIFLSFSIKYFKNVLNISQPFLLKLHHEERGCEAEIMRI